MHFPTPFTIALSGLTTREIRRAITDALPIRALHYDSLFLCEYIMVVAPLRFTARVPVCAGVWIFSRALVHIMFVFARPITWCIFIAQLLRETVVVFDRITRCRRAAHILSLSNTQREYINTSFVTILIFLSCDR